MECERLRDETERCLGVGAQRILGADPIALLPRGPFNLEVARIPRLSFRSGCKRCGARDFADQALWHFNFYTGAMVIIMHTLGTESLGTRLAHKCFRLNMSAHTFLYAVITCPNPDRSFDNSNISAIITPEEPTLEGHYVEGTIVTVSCFEGYDGGGDSICQRNGTWTSVSCLCKQIHNIPFRTAVYTLVRIRTIQ